MSIVLTGGNQTVFPQPFVAPIVETSATWGEGGPTWTVNPELTFVRCELHAGSSGVDSCELVRKYGYTLNTAARDTDFVLRAGENLMGTWVRVKVMGPQQPQVVFVGIIDGINRNLTGDNDTASGEQRFIASGGLRILEKLSIDESVFYDPDTDELITVGWVPPMNKRDKRGFLVGNESPSIDPSGVFDYGGTAVWTHLDYVNYLIANFIQQDDGPTWTVGGQTDVLQNMQTTIDFSQSGSALEMLRQLIPVKYGVDFVITPLPAGFEITIVTLSAQAYSAGGVTMPANPNTFSINKSSQTDLIDCRIVQSNEKAVDEIEVVGKRIVVCGSLRGGRSVGPQPFPSDGDPYDMTGGSLVPKWSDDLEFYYVTANGAADSANSDPGDNDKIRKQKIYSDVYQHLGAPVDWVMGNWAVACDDDGTLTVGSYQTSIRETLSWIPLKVGWDYTQNPPVDNTANLGDGQGDAEFKGILAWVLDENRLITTNSAEDEADDSGYGPSSPYPPYVACEQADIHISVPLLDWGVYLRPSINHVLGLNSFQQNWNGANTPDISLEDPEFDYTTVVATIAIESDHRIRLAYAVPAAMNAGDGSKLVVMDEEAELWVLLQGTIVDVNKEGNLVDCGDQQIVRSDIGRLALVMAGAIARYANQRIRAQFTWNGLLPWSNLMGGILTVFQQGDNSTMIGAAITTLILDAAPTDGTGAVKQPTTIIKTGYA